jgi:hemolysin III
MEPTLLDDPRAASLSPSARRLLRRPRPRLRGVLHRWAALLSFPVGVLLAVGADGSRAVWSVVIFSAGSSAMLAVSAVTHARDWSIDRVELLVRLDHSAIFLTFATSSTPVALLGLDAPGSGWLLGFAWAGAVFGIGAEWTPIHPPAGVMNTIFLVFGASILVFTPWLISALSVVDLLLLFGGGAAYAIGAVVVGARRPDPWTDVFGYHEIWHVFVVVAVASHYLLVARLAW